MVSGRRRRCLPRSQSRSCAFQRPSRHAYCQLWAGYGIIWAEVGKAKTIKVDERPKFSEAEAHGVSERPFILLPSIWSRRHVCKPSNPTDTDCWSSRHPERYNSRGFGPKSKILSAYYALPVKQRLSAVRDSTWACPAACAVCVLPLAQRVHRYAVNSESWCIAFSRSDSQSSELRRY